MVTATLSRAGGGKSVTFTVADEAGTPVIAEDVGKPNAQLYEVSDDLPRSSDQLNPTRAFTVVGQLTGDTAYQDARELADLVAERSYSGGELELSFSGVYSGTYTVAAFDSALSLMYEPGRRQWVPLQLTLLRVSGATGSLQSSVDLDRPAALNTDSGGVTLSNGNDSVAISNNLTVERVVGRPGAQLRRRPADLPALYDARRPASNVFEISGVVTGSDAYTVRETLTNDILAARYGYDTATLSFDDGLYFLGGFNVVPVGGIVGRVSALAGETDMVWIDGLTVREVRSYGNERVI